MWQRVKSYFKKNLPDPLWRLLKNTKKKINEKKRRLLFSISEIINNYPNESEIFYLKHGYPLNLKNPRSFSEKIIWKKVFDRNPLLPRVTDKLLVRDYIQEKLGEKLASEIQIPLLYHSKDPCSIPFEDLPQKYVIKSNHASGHNIFVWDKTKINRQEIIAKCKEWLSDTHGFYRHEWAYQKIKPEILIQELLVDENGKIPWDYKFHIFHRKCRRIVVYSDRFGIKKVTGYDENWNYNGLVSNDLIGPPTPKPSKLTFMIEIAEKLAEDFDYIRVDLYEVNDRVYFGELTSYESSGDRRYSPAEFDYELGSYWKITPGYWKNQGVKKNKLSID